MVSGCKLGLMSTYLARPLIWHSEVSVLLGHAKAHTLVFDISCSLAISHIIHRKYAIVISLDIYLTSDGIFSCWCDSDFETSVRSWVHQHINTLHRHQVNIAFILAFTIASQDLADQHMSWTYPSTKSTRRLCSRYQRARWRNWSNFTGSDKIHCWDRFLFMSEKGVLKMSWLLVIFVCCKNGIQKTQWKTCPI